MAARKHITLGNSCQRQALHGSPDMFMYIMESTVECIRASAGSLPCLTLSRMTAYKPVVYPTTLALYHDEAMPTSSIMSTMIHP